MATNRNTRYARYERKLYSVRKTKHKHRLALHGIAMMLIMVIGLRMCLVQAMDKKQEQEVVNSNVSTTSKVVQMTTPKQIVHEQVSQQKQEEVEICPRFEYSKDRSTDDDYLLAKIAMAEAEGESLETKCLVILTILNRVESSEFPDTVEEVIFQEHKGVYQFSSIGDGRWNEVEPNEECWEAVEIVKQSTYDYSGGALYFEACSGESWHSRNIEFICQSDNTRFYK